MDISERYAKLQATMEAYAPSVRLSAREILSWFDLKGRSVVDFGCGRGDWLKVAREQGATRILGLDTYALDGIDSDIETQHVDLTEIVTLPSRFDYAICTEVGEHLPHATASNLVSSLVKAAPRVVFSAAAPGQGGVDHLNEQPPAFWHALFKAHGYICCDLRSLIWTKSEIEPWYRMGTLVYMAPTEELGMLTPFRVDEPLHLVHPDIFGGFAKLGRDIIWHQNKQTGAWFVEMLPEK
jgi:SAM-dependent methyltransferase